MNLDPNGALAISDAEILYDPEKAVDRLINLYDQQVDLIRQRFDQFANSDLTADDMSHGVYPAVEVEVPAERATMTSSLALGRIAQRHDFATTITHPRLFAAYFIRQLTKIRKRYGATVRVGLSNRPIPLSFALEAATAAGCGAAIIIGAPQYFGELGFTVVAPDRFSFPGPQDMARVMVRDLAGSADALSGAVSAY